MDEAGRRGSLDSERVGKQTSPLGGKSYSHISKGTNVGRGGKLRCTQSSYASLPLREAGKVFSGAPLHDLPDLDPPKIGCSEVSRGSTEALQIGV